MSIWSKINGPRDSVRYTKDKKIVAKSSVPGNIIDHLVIGEDFDDTGIILEAPKKECIFCGDASKMTRLYNTKIVYLCDSHFYSKNMGQIAQLMNAPEIPAEGSYTAA